MLLRRLPVLLTALCVLAPALSRSVSAQSSPGSNQTVSPRFVLHGTVLDSTNAAVVDASIDVVPENGAVPSSSVSDRKGSFTLALNPGRYTLVVAAPGFLKMSKLITAADTGSASVEFVLQVEGVRETVNVSAPRGYQVAAIDSGTKTLTPLRDVPQSLTVVTKTLMQDQLMLSVADVVRYVPGIAAHQGENNRDQVIIRGNNSSADFFRDGARDDVQYYRDLYNVDRVEFLLGPNAMIFGRGGGGGVVNRVTKEAGFMPIRQFMLVGGGFGTKRATIDVNQPLNQTLAVRLNGMYESSESFRQSVNLERYGLNPTLAVVPNSRTHVMVGYEHLRDERVADRGVPSFQGRPADVAISTYFGDPADSHVNARVDLVSATVEHLAGRVRLRNRTLVGHYERGYQNFVPGAVSADRTQVTLSAYNNDVRRLNLFNQTDVTYAASTGGLRHTLLAGVEFGRQLTNNFRNTGFFNNTTTSVLVPYDNPLISMPVTFRQSATDANNHVRAGVAAAYGQDQIELSRFAQLVAGLRFDSFDLHHHDNRTGTDLSRLDHLVSPRAGLVIKPVASLSMYGSYSVSYLPSSGDQFSSLTTVTEQLKPEQFTNYETGTKWDVQSNVSLTAAVYRLDRTNTRSTDPIDPTHIVQSGSQRTNGFELGMNGRVWSFWQVAGGYAYQHAFITSATTAARSGAEVAQVPRHALSWWNMCRVHPRASIGLGLVRRTSVYAAIDDTVTLPGYTDVDAAMYVSLTPRARFQANVENVFNRRYFANADSNTNISPGAPRAIRAALLMKF